MLNAIKWGLAIYGAYKLYEKLKTPELKVKTNVPVIPTGEVIQTNRGVPPDVDEDIRGYAQKHWEKAILPNGMEKWLEADYVQQ